MHFNDTAPTVPRTSGAGSCTAADHDHRSRNGYYRVCSMFEWFDRRRWPLRRDGEHGGARSTDHPRRGSEGSGELWSQERVPSGWSIGYQSPDPGVPPADGESVYETTLVLPGMSGASAQEQGHAGDVRGHAIWLPPAQETER